jgi:ligand-binding sensor domain-containing protein
MINALNIGDIIIARNGFKWVTLPRGSGIYVLDDNNTPDNFSDDHSEKLNIMDGNTMVSRTLSVAEDLDGNIWVGTDQGPFVYYNPDKVFEGQSTASRIKIPRKNDPGYADYMLKNEVITAIAVDGANRKWIGTAGSGAYLLSADGTEELKHFDEQNSPILSNSVISLAVDNKTGEVWFGTSKGIQSYRSNATEGGNEFSKIYSFPNPVRENFTGSVTITGLVRDTEVKITDISGNLVYETMSTGGQASWNLQNYRGTRVSTGVYLVFCSNSDGTQAAVTKILVIH